MKPRMEYRKANPQAFQTMLQMEKFVRSSGLDHKLLELVKTRASQLNGCAYCLDMHTQKREKTARLSSASICSMPGEKRMCTPKQSGRHWL